MIHPTPWTARRFGYERTALLDANGAEVAEFVNEVEAALCAALVNENHFMATRDTSRPPFARLKAPQRRPKLPGLGVAMGGPGHYDYDVWSGDRARREASEIETQPVCISLGSCHWACDHGKVR